MILDTSRSPDLELYLLELWRSLLYWNLRNLVISTHTPVKFEQNNTIVIKKETNKKKNSKKAIFLFIYSNHQRYQKIFFQTKLHCCTWSGIPWATLRMCPKITFNFILLHNIYELLISYQKSHSYRNKHTKTHHQNKNKNKIKSESK